MRQYGLIGKTLRHSFSKKHFSDKFASQNIESCHYDLFELKSITEFPELINKYSKVLSGLNVTIPYKKEVMQYLDELDENAKVIDAVNTIKFLSNGRLKGYNTDYFGFKSSLEKWDIKNKKALVLGAGGASNAVIKVLQDISLSYKKVSRTSSLETISYTELKEKTGCLAEHELIINTTPLGTCPNINEKPALAYSELTKNHLIFDLVYNPETTAFMQEGLNAGAKVKNGYEMLVGQAEAAWDIWNS